MSCSVGCRLGLDPALLWLWGRPAATLPIRPLAWGPPYAMCVALKKTKKKKSVLVYILLLSVPVEVQVNALKCAF